jgi:hypothetical protein
MGRVMEAHPYFGLLLLALCACSGAEKQDVLGSSSSSGTASGGTTSGGTTSGGAGPAIDTTNCTPEQEKNDGREAANIIEGSRCGELTLSDQVDFMVFRLKPSTKEMKLNFKGGVRLKIEIEGRDSIELTPTSNVSVPFVQGKAYYIEVRALEKQSSTPWRIDITES